MRICVVDDEPEIRSLFASCLRAIGFDVLESSSGYETAGLINDSMAHGRIDLVLSDYRMHHGDGGMVASLGADRSIRYVIVTGFPAHDIQCYLPKDTLVLDKTAFSTRLFDSSPRLSVKAAVGGVALEQLLLCLFCETCDTKLYA